MKKLLLLVGLLWLAVMGASSNVLAAPFAMPPYYNVGNIGKYPFYGDLNPTPEAAAFKWIADANSVGIPLCSPQYLFDHLSPYAVFDGRWAMYIKYNAYIDQGPACEGYSPPYSVGSDIRRWVVCDARLTYFGDPLSVGYSKENFPNSQCPDTTPRPEKCPWCPSTDNPVNIPFGFKLLKEIDLPPQYAGGVEFRRYYTSLRYPNEFILPTRGLGNQWRHNYERGILTVFDYGNAAYVLRGDTSVGYFSSTVGGYVSEADSADKLTNLSDGLGNTTGWTYYDARTEDTESYNAQGRLASITSRKGVVQTLSYGANGLLLQVTDSFGRTLSFTYDSAKRIATMTDPSAGRYVFAYAENGALATVTDPASKVRTYLYENTIFPKALTGITDENNWRFSSYVYGTYGLVAETKFHAYSGVEVNKRTLSYSGQYAGGQTTVTEPSGNSRAFIFQRLLGLDRPSNVTQTGGAAELRTFDTSGNVSSTTDFNGNLTCYAYDGSRNLQIIRVEGLPSGVVCSTALSGALVAPARRITTAWHATYRLPTAIGESTSAGDRVTTFAYDPSGNLTGKSVVNAGITRRSSYTYDPFGRVLTATDPRNNTTTNTYYANDAAQGNNRGMLQSVTNAAGHTTTITSYNANGQPLSITDANGLVTSMTYDPRQRMTSRSNGGETTTYTYDGVGQLTKVTMPDASYLNYTYDGAHRLTQIQDGLNNKVVYTLDNSGNRIKEDYVDPTNALSRTRSRAYDALNRMQQDIGGATPASQITQYAYDANGNQSSMTDPLARVTSQSYDALNRLMQVVDPFNGSAAPTKYEYDAQDNLTKVTDPKNLATVYVYNGFNELTSQSSPDTGSTAFTYDPTGNMLTKTDARGVTSTYTYDALNRVTTISYPAYQSDPAETVTYTYDGTAMSCTNGKGRLCSLTDKTGTTSYSYDIRGRALSKSQTTTGLTQSIGYRYNTAGQMDRMTLPSGKFVDYTYLNNRITAITYDGKQVIKNADYEPFGPLGEWTWGNDSVASPNKHVRYFDLDGRNTKIESGSSIDPAIIVYDAASRITDLQKLTANAVDPAKSTTYGYDNLDRLTNVTPNAGNANPARGFTYDAVGNRLTATLASSVTNYSYGATSHRLNGLTGATSKTFSYDNDGNRTTDGTSTWSYGGNNRPTSINIPGASVVVQAGINALGQRVTKSVNGIVTRFMYDEAGRLIGEYDLDGKPQQETLWFNDLPVAVIK